MSDESRGIAGDRRRNPFPSLNDTEYELFLATIREQVSAGVRAALAEDCVRKCSRVEDIEATVFGRAERGVVGLDDRLRAAESTLETLRRITWLAVGAMITSFVALVVAIFELTIFNGKGI